MCFKKLKNLCPFGKSEKQIEERIAKTEEDIIRFTGKTLSSFEVDLSDIRRKLLFCEARMEAITQEMEALKKGKEPTDTPPKGTTKGSTNETQKCAKKVATATNKEVAGNK